MRLNKLFFLLLFLSVLLLSGCEITAYSDTYGHVINADTGDGLEQTSVGLRRPDGTTYASTTTASDGSYYFSGIPVGEYVLTAVRTGYAFTEEPVHVSWDSSGYLPTIAGFEYDSDEPDFDLKIITVWDSGFADVDAYLTFPNEAHLWDIDADVNEYRANHYDFYTNTASAPGFSPDNPGTVGTEASDDRLVLYSGEILYQDIANMKAGTWGGPETVTVLGAVDVGDTDEDDYYVYSAGDFSGLPETGSYDWAGVMEYYLVAVHRTSISGTIDPNAALSSDNNRNAAKPTVFVFDSTGAQKGVYRQPESTFIHAASVLRINIFFHENGQGYYQILPDQRIAMSAKAGSGQDIVVIPARKTRGE